MLSIRYLSPEQRRPWDEIISSMRARRAPQIKTEPAKTTSPNTSIVAKPTTPAAATKQTSSSTPPSTTPTTTSNPPTSAGPRLAKATAT